MGLSSVIFASTEELLAWTLFLRVKPFRALAGLFEHLYFEVLSSKWHLNWSVLDSPFCSFGMSLPIVLSFWNLSVMTSK